MSFVEMRYHIMQFQSTLLMRGATFHTFADIDTSHDFNPRSSCEERRC